MQEKLLSFISNFNSILLKLISYFKGSFKNNLKISWIIGFLIIILSNLIRNGLMLGCDSGFYIYTSERLLGGQKYFYDFFETNFPLNFYIYMIPVLISKYLHIDIVFSFNLFFHITGLLSIYFSTLIIKSGKLYKDKVVSNLMIIGLFFIYFLRPNSIFFNEFYTKSSLVLLFLMPYFFSFFNEDRKFSVATKILLGICLGNLFFLKQTFVIIPFILEVHYMFLKKNFFTFLRLDVYVAFLIFILNLLFLVFIVPEFLFNIIPIAQIVYKNFLPKFFDFFSQVLYENLPMFLLILLFIKKIKADNFNLFLFGYIGSILYIFCELKLGLDRTAYFYLFQILLFIFCEYYFIIKNHFKKTFFQKLLIFLTIIFGMYLSKISFIKNFSLYDRYLCFSVVTVIIIILFYLYYLKDNKIKMRSIIMFYFLSSIIFMNYINLIELAINGNHYFNILSYKVNSKIQTYLDKNILKNNDNILFLNSLTGPAFPTLINYRNKLKSDFKIDFMYFSKLYYKGNLTNDKKAKDAEDYIDSLIYSSLNKNPKMIISEKLSKDYDSVYGMVFEKSNKFYDKYGDMYINKNKYELIDEINIYDNKNYIFDSFSIYILK